MMPVTNKRVRSARARAAARSRAAWRSRSSRDGRRAGSATAARCSGTAQVNSADARRRAMRVLVDRLVGGGAGVAEIRRDVDAVGCVCRPRRRRKQPVDESGGDAVRRGREQRLCGVRPSSASISSSAENRAAGYARRKCGKAAATARTRLAVRQHRRDLRACGCPAISRSSSPAT